MTITARSFMARVEFYRTHGKQPNRLRLSPKDHCVLQAEVLAGEARLTATDEREEWISTGGKMQIVVDPAATELSVYWEEE